jgi:hypothetical protein
MIMLSKAAIGVLGHRAVRVRSVGDGACLMRRLSAKQAPLDLWVWATTHWTRGERVLRQAHVGQKAWCPACHVDCHVAVAVIVWKA